MVIVVLCSNPRVEMETYLSPCEQAVSCPESLRGGSISFKTASSSVTGYITKDEPSINKTQYQVTKTVNGETIKSGGYVYHSFNLIKGSKLEWNIKQKSSSSTFLVYLVQGYNEYSKFDNYETFNYVKYTRGSSSQSSYTSTEADEYFLIIEAAYSSITLDDYQFDAYYSRYDLSSYVKKSSSSTDFDIDSSLVPGVCIIADMPCPSANSDTDSVKVNIDYKLAYGGLFYVCLAFAIIFAVGVVASILACVICAKRKSTGTTGNTYQPVAATPAAVQPTAYPAGYQTPQPVQSYQTATVPAAYNPSAPVYPTAAGAPAYAPGYEGYGTAPVAPAY